MITFTETTGILDKRDIERKTRMWQFDASAKTVKLTWTGEDGQFHSRVDSYDGGPLTINSFINANLNPNVGRCAALNGSENFVLIADGSWDRPLHDGDIVGLVPAVGDAWLIAEIIYYVIMAALMAYAIYMIATMKTGDGSSSTTVYSLSQTQNEKRPGQVVERQYGRLKFKPSYAANPYTIYSSNAQWLYAIYCLGYGKFAIEEYGFDKTDSSNYSDLTFNVVGPNEWAGYFHNNVISSSEVSGGIELIPYNEGKNNGQDGAWEDYGYEGPNGWTSWDTPYGPDDGWTAWITANPVGTSASRLIIDLEFPNGLGHTKKDGDSQSYTVAMQVQYRSRTKASDGSINYGTVVSKVYSYTKSTSTFLRYTEQIDVGSGSYDVRCRRTTKRDALNSANGQRTRETIQWTNLRAVLQDQSYFGDVTCIMMKAKAQNGLTDAASKRFYALATAYCPVYDPETNSWIEMPTRNPVWAAVDIWHSSNAGNFSYELIDLDNIVTWAKWCDDNDIHFDYRFNSQEDIDTQIKTCLRVFRATPNYSTGKFRIIRDERQTIPTAVFTKENIVADSFQIQYKGVTEDEYDGWSVEYTDEDDDWDTDTVPVLLASDDGSNPKTVTMKGITNRTKAYRQGMYERSVDKENRAAISFETTIHGWLATVGDLIYVNHPLFRQHVSGHILSISGTTIVLDCNVKLNSEYTNYLKIRNPVNGKILGTYTVSYASESDYHTLTLDSAPTTTALEFDDPQALPIFVLGIGTNFAKNCRVTKTQNTTTGTKIECFIDTDKRFAYENAYPDTGTPNYISTITIPAAPSNIAAIPYDPESSGTPTDITISWDAVSGFGTYIVQYSTDGETWTTVTSSTSTTSVKVGSYVSGTFYAHVAVVYNGNIWAWGYSDETYMPASTLEYVYVTIDNFIDTTADSYKYVSQG